MIFQKTITLGYIFIISYCLGQTWPIRDELDETYVSRINTVVSNVTFTTAMATSYNPQHYSLLQQLDSPSSSPTTLPTTTYGHSIIPLCNITIELISNEDFEYDTVLESVISILARDFVNGIIKEELYSDNSKTLELVLLRALYLRTNIIPEYQKRYIAQGGVVRGRNNSNVTKEDLHLISWQIPCTLSVHVLAIDGIKHDQDGGETITRMKNCLMRYLSKIFRDKDEDEMTSRFITYIQLKGPEILQNLYSVNILNTEYAWQQFQSNDGIQVKDEEYLLTDYDKIRFKLVVNSFMMIFLCNSVLVLFCAIVCLGKSLVKKRERALVQYHVNKSERAMQLQHMVLYSSGADVFEVVII